MASSALNHLPERALLDELDTEALVRREGTRIWRSLKYLGVPESELADACQEVFLVVHRRLKDFRGDSRLETWIYGICLGVARNARRRRKRAPELRSEPWDLTMEATQEADLEQDRTRALLSSALEQIAPEQREVFVLHEIEELGMRAVAGATGSGLFTAYSRLRLARRALAKLLDAYRKERP